MSHSTQDDPRSKEASQLPIYLSGIAMTAAFVGAVWLDSLLGVTAWWQMKLALIGLAGLILLPVWFNERRGTAARMLGAFTVSVLVLGAVELTPVKPFHLFEQDVESGMLRAEVFTSLERRFPEGGRFRRPVFGAGDGEPVLYPPPDMASTPDETIHFTLDPSDSRYDSEWFVVYLQEGRVVGEDYSGD